ncbi:inner membrane-spanning protein YciB [soil metagenome]
MTQTESLRRESPPWLKAVVDYLGPVAFLIGFFVMGRNLLFATWWLVGGSAVALLLSLIVVRRVPPMPLIWGGAALIFGTLSLIFHDTTFVKMKTTFVDLALASALFIGLRIGKNPLKLMMGDALKLTETGWRKLTIRYGLFFLAMAVLNEIIWRTQPDSVWVLFRMPGLLILAALFAVTQLPMMMKDMKAAEAAAALTELQE